MTRKVNGSPTEPAAPDPIRRWHALCATPPGQWDMQELYATVEALVSELAAMRERHAITSQIVAHYVAEHIEDIAARPCRYREMRARECSEEDSPRCESCVARTCLDKMRSWQ